MPDKRTAIVNAADGVVEMERVAPSSPWSVQGGKPAEVVRVRPGMYHVNHKGRSYQAVLIKQDREQGILRLRIGANVHTVRLQNERARLMDLLGIDRSAKARASELKAPMPGLVIKVLVKEGDQVEMDEPLLVLEAMKMENVIKSSGEGVVKNVYVKEDTTVEKGSLLLSFD